MAGKSRVTSPQMDQISAETSKAQRSCFWFQEICGSRTARNPTQCILCGWRHMFCFSWCVLDGTVWLCIFSPFYLLSQGISRVAQKEHVVAVLLCVWVSKQKRKSQILAVWGKKKVLHRYFKCILWGCRSADGVSYLKPILTTLWGFPLRCGNFARGDDIKQLRTEVNGQHCVRYLVQQSFSNIWDGCIVGQANYDKKSCLPL